MIYLNEIQKIVNTAYLTLAKLQFMISIREPVSGDTKTFNRMYTLSTKIIANLEYINMLNLNHSYIKNNEIENIVFSLKEIIQKVKSTWD
jgi:hypothetical protein